ncbi:MAG: hypothetical protein ACI9X4_001513 [Glaciecola sp.]|jgi:hypothetical protein
MGAALEGHLTPAALAQGFVGLEDLKSLLDVPVSAFLRQLPGRQTFLWPSGGARWVVKRFEGDDRGDRRFDRRAGQAGRSPGQREYDNLLALSARGLRVPEPLAWLGQGDRSLLLMEYVPHAENLRGRLTDSPESWKLWRASLLEMTLALHAPSSEGVGAYHRDFYLQHLLITSPQEALCLIDVGRVRLKKGVRQRWFEKDLAALAHSAPTALGELARLAWLRRYLKRLLGPLDRAGTRKRLFAWAKAIQNRRRRMEKHQPRHGEATTQED